ncbi:MAG: hypothetical protein HQL75_06870 [Magnetococcales bacterium]|nr:hypothetical protein [Magnetococcales bacterium]
MQSMQFDLNDIEHEPSDEQLKALMDAVVIEANRRAERAHVVLMQRLRDDILNANRARMVE